MQTSIEWLVDQLTNVDRPNYTNKRILAISKNSLQEKRINELVEQAKEMEKQQRIDAYCNGCNQCLEDNKDKRFSLDEMRRAFEVGQAHGTLYKGNNFERFISSLTQPKDTWECEFINGQLKLT